MRSVILAAQLSALSLPALAQTAPTWHSLSVTGNRTDCVSSPAVATWLGTKTDLLGVATGATARRDWRDRFADSVDVLDFQGADPSGRTDSSGAFQAAINAATNPLRMRDGIYLPPGGTYLIDTGLTATVGGDQRFRMFSGGLHGAKLVFPAGFTGTGLAITMTGGASDQAAGFGTSMDGVTFMRAGTDTGGTALSITTSGGGAAMPALDISKLVFTSATGGSFATGVSLIADNVTTVSDVYCTNGFKGTCISYDTPGQISVEHHIKDVYINGGPGGVGIAIGDPNLSGPLQGFTIRGLSCTGPDYCIKAQSNNSSSRPIDEIVVEGSQLNATITNILDNGADTLVAVGNYFLAGSRGIDAENMNRLVVTGNTFYLGPDASANLNSSLAHATTHNISIYTANLGGGPASGSVISGNLFTNLYGVPVYYDTGTNYVLFSGNNCLGNQCVNDYSGNTGNGVGLNSDSGYLAFGSMPRFYQGFALSARGGAATYDFTTDGVGNATINSTLGTGAGLLTIGPNEHLLGTSTLDNVKISAGTATLGTVNATTLTFDPTGTAPASSSASCTQGQAAWATGYLYICVSANTWQRAALASF